VKCVNAHDDLVNTLNQISYAHISYESACIADDAIEMDKFSRMLFQLHQDIPAVLKRAGAL